MHRPCCLVRRVHQDGVRRQAQASPYPQRALRGRRCLRMLYPRMNTMRDWDDYDPYWGHYNAEEEEELERRERQAEHERLQAMSPEDLGKEWERQCRRHDSAVDRCEQLNSPTIEDSQGKMNWIEAEFERRGLKHWDYTLK